MTNTYGASPETWLHWAQVLALREDMLPVVCEPHLPIAPNSALTSYGKVPSRFDREGRVVGFPKWTQYRATEGDIERWSADSRLGICLQTREVRAFDLDVDDTALVNEIVHTIGRVASLPMRTRENSPKCLLLFRMSGGFSKQVLTTEHGMIEFLASGQQCLIAGTHSSGARYEWMDGHPASIPALTERQFEDLKEVLSQLYGTKPWTAGRAAKARDAGAVTGTPFADDPVAAYLLAIPELVTAQHADRLDVLCPWSREHTSKTDVSSTSYFPGGTGGYETGSFRCLHSHCEDRATSDFLMAIGYMAEGFEDISVATNGTNESLQAFLDGVPAIGEVEHPVNGVPKFIRTDQHIRVLIYNVVEALRHPEWAKMFVRLDTFTGKIMIGPPGSCRMIHESDSTRLNIHLTENTFGPGAVSDEMITRAIKFVAHERAYDAAVEWLTGLPEWDGVSRIEHFCAHYLGSEDTPYHRAVGRYWWTSHAARVLSPRGIQADAAIILVSPQGTGKTTTVKSIVPNEAYCAAIHLNAKREDIIRDMRGRMIMEMAELQGLKSRDAESIKALISAVSDTFTNKYEKYAEDVPRRCLFVGSSNNDDFLSDHTGNRRFLPVYVGDRQALEKIVADRDQLWAEGKFLFEALGEVDWRDAQRLVRAEHCKFEEIDAWEEKVFQWLDHDGNWEVDDINAVRTPYVTSSKALWMALGMDYAKQSARDMHRMVRVFTRYGLKKTNHRLLGHQTRIWIR